MLQFVSFLSGSAQLKTHLLFTPMLAGYRTPAFVELAVSHS